jgi:hypothetical protein
MRAAPNTACFGLSNSSLRYPIADTLDRRQWVGWGTIAGLRTHGVGVDDNELTSFILATHLSMRTASDAYEIEQSIRTTFTAEIERV